jgi:hypothetical protein
LTSTIIQIDIKWKDSNKIWLDENMCKLAKFGLISRNVTTGSQFCEPQSQIWKCDPKQTKWVTENFETNKTKMSIFDKNKIFTSNYTIFSI